MQRANGWALAATLSAAACGAAVVQSLAARAQTLPDPEPMMRVGECMANVDPAALESLQTRGRVFRDDLRRFCTAGRRDAALQHARQFGQDMAGDPVLKQIRACTAGLPLPQQDYGVPAARLNPADICSQ